MRLSLNGFFLKVPLPPPPPPSATAVAAATVGEGKKLKEPNYTPEERNKSSTR